MAGGAKWSEGEAQPGAHGPWPGSLVVCEGMPAAAARDQTTAKMYPAQIVPETNHEGVI